jgi:hypothetical protein
VERTEGRGGNLPEIWSGSFQVNPQVQPSLRPLPSVLSARAALWSRLELSLFEAGEKNVSLSLLSYPPDWRVKLLIVRPVRARQALRPQKSLLEGLQRRIQCTDLLGDRFFFGLQRLHL